MPRPSFISHRSLTVLASLLFCWVGTGIPTMANPVLSQAQASSLPNIVLLMADDLGWGDPGFNGGNIIHTPHLDAMARAGLKMNRFYAQSPVCSPTRGSCLTGRHPFRYGIFFANTGHLKAREITLAQLLRTRGYTTGHFGKWHLGTLTREIQDGRRGGRSKNDAHYSPPWERGFDQCFSTEVQMPTWNPMTNQNFPSKYWTGPGQFATTNLAGDDSRVIMDRALSFVDKALGDPQPFLAVIWFHTPHEPVIGGPAYLELYADHPEAARHYYACITSLDEQVGRLRQHLRNHKASTNTVLFFCSDNGPEGAAAKGRQMGSTGPFRGRKRSLFEGGIRVPAVIEWPGHIAPGQVTEYPAVTTDYLPTILELTGQKMPDDRALDGISLVPLLQGKTMERKQPIYFQTRGGLKSKTSRGSPAHAMTESRYKLLTDFDSNGTSDRLYDLVKDPGETINLAAQEPARVKRMKNQLRAWKDQCQESNLDSE